MKKVTRLLLVFMSVMFIGINIAKAANVKCPDTDNETAIEGGYKCTYAASVKSRSCTRVGGTPNASTGKCEATVTGYTCSATGTKKSETVSWNDSQEEPDCPSYSIQEDQGEHFKLCGYYLCPNDTKQKTDNCTTSTTGDCPTGYGGKTASSWKCGDTSSSSSICGNIDYTYKCREDSHELNSRECSYTIMNDGTAVTGVTVSPKTDNISVYETTQLTATIEPTGATNKNVTWSSSDETVATVSNSGLVTAKKAGTATITVKTVDGNKTDTSTINVIDFVEFDPDQYTCRVGETITATVYSTGNPTFDTVSHAIATATESDETPKCVKKDASGAAIPCKEVKINCLAKGSTRVTATVTKVSVVAPLTVTDSTTPATEDVVRFAQNSYNCKPGQTIHVIAKATKKPTYSSSASTVATIKESVYEMYTNCVAANSSGNTSSSNYQTNCISFEGQTQLFNYMADVTCLTEGTATLTATLSSTVKATAGLTSAMDSSETHVEDKTLTFNANGGVIVYGDVDNDTVDISDASNKTLAQFVSGFTITKEGYELVGWFTAETGGDEIPLERLISDISATTLYAHWIEGTLDPTKTKYTLTYDSNGGTACQQATHSVNEGDSWGTLCTPTKDGYKFNGWFTQKTGGTRVNSDDPAERDLTVYAQWRAKSTDTNAKTGIFTPIIAIVVLGLISTLVFFIIRKRNANLN